MSPAAVSLAGTPDEDTAAATAVSIGPSVVTDATAAAAASTAAAAEAPKGASSDGRNESSTVNPKATFLTGVSLAAAE